MFLLCFPVVETIYWNTVIGAILMYLYFTYMYLYKLQNIVLHMQIERVTTPNNKVLLSYGTDTGIFPAKIILCVKTPFSGQI